MLFIVKLLNKVTSSKKHIGWLLADLLVVFVGVYGAFLLGEYKETEPRTETTDNCIAYRAG